MRTLLGVLVAIAAGGCGNERDDADALCVTEPGLWQITFEETEGDCGPLPPQEKAFGGDGLPGFGVGERCYGDIDLIDRGCASVASTTCYGEASSGAEYDVESTSMFIGPREVDATARLSLTITRGGVVEAMCSSRYAIRFRLP